MPHPKPHLPALLTILALTGLLLGACGGGRPGTEPGVATPAGPPQGTQAVDVVFREFYNLLGGEGTLGYAISPPFEYQGYQMQYTQNALLRYDARTQAGQQYSLAPLGQEMGVTDSPLPVLEQSGVFLVDGYVIYDEFLELYRALQAGRFVGQPLSQVRIDPQRQRIEQYFTNAGFYRSLSDPPGTVHLLAYGAWKCAQACPGSADPSAEVSPDPAFPQPFIASLSRLGSDLTGLPLSEPYLAQDGRLEQIYENVVVCADPGNILAVRLRPLTNLLGYPSSEAVPRIDDPRLVFYPLDPAQAAQDGALGAQGGALGAQDGALGAQDGTLGHHVPTVFDQYISLHGGMDISGPPHSELFAEGSVYRQCFANYCLDYDPAAEETRRIRPAPMGTHYLELFPPAQAAHAERPISAQSIDLRVWEAHALVASGQAQQVSIQALQSQSQTPIPNLEAVLELTRPDGRRETYPFAPTGPDGTSSLDLPGIEAPNGTLVPYRVCLQLVGDDPAKPEPLCVLDSYVIWGK